MIMATSQGVNVLRYSALFAGVLYGLYHQSSINAQTKSAQVAREYDRKASLIDQAKAEWTKKSSPSERKIERSGIVTDPEDKRFDLEAFLMMKAAETTK